MDKFEILKNNSWIDNNIKLIPGYSENFVLDKTTDTAKIKIKYNSLVIPDWHKGDWCRILHKETATYTSREFIVNKYKNVNNFTCVDNPSLKTITITTELNFIENINCYIIFNDRTDDIIKPIEILAGVKTTVFDYSPYADTISHIYLNSAFEYLASFTETANIPLNHEQYIIKNITSVEDILNNEIDIQLDLEEPTEIAKGIICETKSFTNQILKTVGDNIYKKSPLTYLSVLETVLKITPANCDSYIDGYVKNNNISWFNRIKIIDNDLLNKIKFNDETFSEPSLYDILFNKYDNGIGRTPALFFDIDGTTDLPYNANRKEYILQFLRQDGLDKEEIELSDLLIDSKLKIVSENGDNFVDGLVCNVDNLTTSTQGIFPSQTLWVVPEINSNERELTSYTETSEIGKWILKLPHNIKNIQNIYKVNVTINTLGTSSVISRFNYHYKSGSFILEEKEYNANTKYNTRNAIWYKEGTNIIHLNEFYYTAPDFFSNTIECDIYRVEYEPLLNLRYDLGKDYQNQVNQIDSGINDNNLGKYLNNYFNSLNKADITIQKTVYSYDDIIELGTIVNDTTKKYIITNVSIVNRGFEYDVVYQLNENHIRINDSIRPSQEIRKNIEIGFNSTKERKTMLNDEYKLSFETIPTTTHKFNIDKKIVFSTLLKNNGYTNANIPQIAYLNLNSILIKNDVKSIKNDVKSNYNIQLLGELAKCVIGNTICYNIKYLDNAEAGKNKTLEILEKNGHTFYGKPKNQIPVLYTDVFGEVQKINFKFLNINNIELSDIDQDINDNLGEFIKTNNVINSMANYPLATGITSDILNNYIFYINNFNYYKDMLDILNITIGINYVADYKIIFCEAFFNKNILMVDSIGNNFATQIQTFATNLSENDYNYNNALQTKNITTAEINSNNNLITITAKQCTGSYKSLVLINDLNEPILIINDINKLSTTFWTGITLKINC